MMLASRGRGDTQNFSVYQRQRSEATTKSALICVVAKQQVVIHIDELLKNSYF